MAVPNVNMMLGYVDCLRNKNPQDDYVKENFDKRRFYSSGKDYDYVKYMNTGSKEKLDYVSYSGNNEKSCGIFNEKGLLNSDETRELRNKLRETDSVIWHGVVSFPEDFGDEYCNSYEKAFALMKSELPKFFKNAELIPDNIEWFAALHENTDNKHIHFSFFEKSPLRYRQGSRFLAYSDGLLPQKAINKAKISMELKLLNISSDIVANRKTLTQEMQRQIDLGAYMNKIKKLIFILPTQGRLAYDSENMNELRPQIDTIVNLMIKTNPEIHKKYLTFESILNKRDNELKRAYTNIKIDYSDKLLRDKYIQDLHRRLGNIVIHTAKDIKLAQAKLNIETTNRLKQKRYERLKRKILLNKCMNLNSAVDREIINCFQEYLNRLEEANYHRLQEEGYFD